MKFSVFNYLRTCTFKIDNNLNYSINLIKYLFFILEQDKFKK